MQWRLFRSAIDGLEKESGKPDGGDEGDKPDGGEGSRPDDGNNQAAERKVTAVSREQEIPMQKK